jgi:hypothetical protein
MNNNIVTILQPSFVPYLGFFSLASKCNTWIHLDNVQYTKRDWRNRNYLAGKNGKFQITIPVLSKNTKIIKDVKIDYSTEWSKKIIRSIYLNYNKCFFFQEYFYSIESIFNKKLSFLIDVNLEFFNFFCQILKIQPQIFFASETKIPSYEKSEYLAELCLKYKATQFNEGIKGKNFLNEDLFHTKNIKVNFFNYQIKEYEQSNTDSFIPYLSIIDAVMNLGGKGAKELL